ncbi:MAG: hypothetical protein MUC30_01500 [Bacteroidales bacterium]|jgi:hypothetical protein|nr:hypothetical protein [Bacteroidales bacterium]
MDFNTALGIIRRDMEEARALLDQISELPGKHIAEIELARSRMRSASELLAIIPKMLEEKEVVKAEVMKEEKIMAGVGAQKEEETKVRIEKEEETQVRIEKEEETQVRAEVRETAKPILADKFSSTDRIGQMVTSVKQDELITSAMHNRPISDIGAAIGINDKFYFIRELFSGDSKAYQDTIRRLNGAVSLGEAMKILDDSTVMGSDPAAQSSFVDVVRRKFNINV